MPRQLPLHVRRQRTRHGRIVYYYRRGRLGRRIRLPDPASPEFPAAYAAAISAAESPPPPKARSGSMAWLIERYKLSAHWAALAPSTRGMRDNILKHVLAVAGDKPFASITRRLINEAIDRRRPHAGNNFRKVMSGLFKWASSLELVAVNPVDGANRHAVRSPGHHVWSIEEVERFRQRWALGSRQRLAMDLMLFTGLRRSDVCRIGRQHVSGGVISIRARKTGKMAHIPICTELRAAIEAAPTGELVFIATQAGRPFASAASFGTWFGRACRAARVPGRAHGLRKAGATLAAEGGATAHELMAMYGWASLREAEVYTRQADRRRLAAGAAERIANAMAPHPDPECASPSEKC